MKYMGDRNARRLAALLVGLCAGTAYGQESKLPAIEVKAEALKPNQGSAEAAYRVDSTYSLGPLGTAKLPAVLKTLVQSQ